jgi:hypothetical protein
MAVNVNTVYRTVLLIINKEQRGYLTPDEFNRTAAQVQLEIFNEYFEDLNQQLRIPANDSEYSDRIKNLEEKISVFQDSGNCTYSSGKFNLPTLTAPAEFYKLGTVIYKDEKEVQYVQPNELLELNLSPITKPSVYWPVYKYKDYQIQVYPSSIQSDISCTYLRKPLNPEWSFISTAPTFQYNYDSSNSVNFELHPTEQTNIITRILMYSGIVIKDPQIVQAAAQQVQLENMNSKS